EVDAVALLSQLGENVDGIFRRVGGELEIIVRHRGRILQRGTGDHELPGVAFVRISDFLPLDHAAPPNVEGSGGGNSGAMPEVVFKGAEIQESDVVKDERARASAEIDADAVRRDGNRPKQAARNIAWIDVGNLGSKTAIRVVVQSDEREGAVVMLAVHA